jgi:hypothetical protein
MRRFATLAVFVLFAPALAGCLTSETLIKLNADGSGTIEQVMLMNVKTFDALPALMGDALGADVTSTKSTGASIDPAGMFDETQARAAAEQLGRGVRFVSSEPLTRGDLQGARMVYAFDDVNTLTIQQDPPGDVLGGGAKSTSEPLALRLTRQANGHALLTVDLEGGSRETKSTAPAAKAGRDDMPPGMEAMVAQLFEGFRISIDVEVAGVIARTSSPFATGSRVTVLEMDLGMLVKDQANLKRFGSIGPDVGVAEMIPLLKDVKGIKVNQSPITIEFSGR